MGGGVMELSMPLAPVVVVYGVACVLLNAAINWLNERWRNSRQVWLDQPPPMVAKWLQENPGVRAFHGAPGHPFTPLLVIAGVLMTLAAAGVVLWDQRVLGQDAILVVFTFFAVGGIIMTAGDAYRYLVYG